MNPDERDPISVELPLPVALNRAAWLRGVGWLSVGTILSLGLTAVAGLLLARFLDPKSFGVYAAITVATSIAGSISTFGLDLHLVTVLGRRETERTEYRVAQRAAFLLSSTATCAGVAVAWLAFGPSVRGPLLLDLGEVWLAPLLLRQVVLQVRMQQRQIVVTQLANRLSWVVAVALVAGLHPTSPLRWVMLARVAILLFQAGALYIAAPLSPSPQIARRPPLFDSLCALKASAPLAMSTAAGIGYNRLDQLLIEGLRGPYLTGLYAGAVRIAELPSSITVLVQSVATPGLVAARREGRQRELFRVLDDALLLMLVPGGCVVALLAGLSGPVLNSLLGHSYSPASIALVILAASDWWRFPGAAFASLALAANHRKQLSASVAAGFGLNVILNVLLIPLLGIEGAALASFLGYGVSSIMTAVLALQSPRDLFPSYMLVARLAISPVVAATAGAVLPMSLVPRAIVLTLTYFLATLMLLPHSQRRRIRRRIAMVLTRPRASAEA